MAAPRIIDYGRIEPGWRADFERPTIGGDEYQAETGKP